MNIGIILKPLLRAELSRPDVTALIHKVLNERIHALAVTLSTAPNAIEAAVGRSLLMPELETEIDAFVDREVDALIQSAISRL